MAFKLIAITPEQTLADEAERIGLLLDAGFDYVHLRKPQMDAAAMRDYLLTLPPRYAGRLKMHYFMPLAEEFGLGGVHLNGRCQQPPAGWTGQVSRSCHSLAEVAESRTADYVFLSPIFDSISKQGYRQAFSEEQLRGAVDDRVVALGGATAARMAWLGDVGFGGCAFLGYLFAADRVVFERRVGEIVNERNKMK